MNGQSDRGQSRAVGRLVVLFVPVFVSAGLLTAVVWKCGIRAVGESLAHLKVAEALLVVSLSVSCVVIAAVNVWLLLTKVTDIPLRSYAKVYFKAWAFGLVCPGQVGDATQIWMLKRYGVTWLQSGGAYVADKVISLGVTVILGFGSVGYLSRWVRWTLEPVELFAVCSGVFVLVVALVRLLRESWWASAVQSCHKGLDFAWRSRGRVGVNVLLSFAKWGVTGWCYSIAMRSCGADVDYLTCTGLAAACSLVAYVPVSFGGIGTVEATAVYAFGAVGVDASQVVAAYLLLRVLQAVTALCILWLGRGSVETA